MDVHQSWNRPPEGWYKCNFDASFNQNTNHAISGWILRDCDGIAKCLGSSNLDYTSSPLEAECKALLTALQIIWCKGYKKIIFEGDCQILVNATNKDYEEV